MADELRFIDFGLIKPAKIMAATEAMYRLADREGTSVGYIWHPVKSIILGYSQIVEKEFNVERSTNLGYELTRRISGGGVAFASEDSQIQYGFIGNMREYSIPFDIIESYEMICQIMSYALEKFGLKGVFKPINDVLCNGKKISGSAQTRGNQVVLQNGTLLSDMNIREMLTCCNIPLEKISDKGISSVEERLTDLKRELNREVGLDEVREAMLYGFEQTFDVTLSMDELNAKEKKLTDSLLPKYYDRDWIYRHSSKKTSFGSYESSMEIREFGVDEG